jgi:hypothetical protein
MAVTDQEALRYYLGREEPALASMLPAAILDEGSMESMPVLGRHAIA